MVSKPESVDAKLEAIQEKLDLIHHDIKRLAPGSVTSVRDAQPSSERVHSQPTSSMAIGRGARVNIQQPTLDPAASAEAANANTPSFLPPIGGSQAPCGAGSGGQQKKVVLTAAKSPEHTDVLNNRRKAQAAKQKLQEFIKPMLVQQGEGVTNELASAPCAWLLSIALACSYVSGEKVTIEDILRQNRLAMHYVSFPSVTLAELFDVTNEFVESHPAMVKTKTRCEVVTFDAEAVDESSDGMSAEEQSTIRTLSQFRKELSTNEENPMYIINFDPYLIEQHEIRMRLNYTENPDCEGPPDPIKPRWSAKNQGTFALITDFRPALHSVSFGVPILLEDGHIVIEEHGVPLQTLYNALCVKDGYCNRSRGFVRVFVSERHMEKVPSIFPLDMLDGSLSGGLLMTAVDASIAPHIVGLALMHHLVSCTLINEEQHRESDVGRILDRGKLRGIPVTMLCQVLNLDIATIVGNSTKVSVCRAFSWYRVFLKKLNLADAVALGVVLINRRGDAADGPVNITDDTFMAHIDLVVKTKSVMLIGFNVNIALNVMVDQRAEPCHFAIVIGFDAEQGVVRLADVSVKKYRKTWNVPLPRLYSAVIGYGYILAAKSPETVSQLNAQQFEDSILSDARYSLPPTMRLLRFEYPKKNYVVTILAEALDTLGFDANVETVANLSGFHTSFMLSAHLPLESAATVARNYSHNHLSDKVSVFTTHMDKDGKHSSPKALVDQILSALESPKERCLIVNFDPVVIQSNREVWNGSSGGPYAIVLGYDKERAVVTLSDANHEAFFRAWVCPLDVLFEALCAVDSISLRARGTLLLATAMQDDNYAGTYGYDMCHSIVHHPFKPSVWPALHCLALVASEMCNSSGSGSVSNTGQYCSEDFLYTKTTFSVHDSAVACRLNSDEIVDFANTAFERLLIPLEASVVDFAAAGTFFEACRDAMANNKPVTMTLLGYDTLPIHGVQGFSVGVVNRVRDAGPDSSVQVVDGNGCTLGSVWERKATELSSAVTAMVRIKRKTAK